MPNRVVIPYDVIQPVIGPRIAPMRRYGIGPASLIAYAIEAPKWGSYNDLAGHLTKDLLEVYPDLLESSRDYQTLLHGCIDCVQEVGASLFEVLSDVLRDNGLEPHNVHFDRLVGDDLVVTIA